MDLDKNKIFVAGKEQTNDFLQFLKEQKEASKVFKEKCAEIAKQINKDYKK